MCSQVLDRLKMVFIPKSNANLVINITCVLFYLSRALNIWVHKPYCTRFIFWVSYFRPWFLWHDFSLLSVHCVSPHQRSHKLRQISTLKTKYHLLWLPPWNHNLSLSMDHQLKEVCKMVPRLKISSIIPKEKYFQDLHYLYHRFARGRANV
jgi:hypothetical protein